MKYVKSKVNRKVIKQIEDIELIDFLATGEWDETTQDEFDVAYKEFISKSKGTSSKVAKDEI